MKLHFPVLRTLFIFLYFGSLLAVEPKRIAVIGTGYVGLVTGAGLALVHRVTCCDIDQSKIDRLNSGSIPIVEEGLAELVASNVSAGRLDFTSDIPSALQKADVIFIAVGTPMADDGQADLSYVDAVARTIGQCMNGYKVVVTKSTVPVGTGNRIAGIIGNYTDHPFDVVSNPEFLREGTAVYDFLRPDRLVVGASSDEAHTAIRQVYEPWLDNQVPIIATDVTTSEAIKYASNAFLAVKISFINEFANLCEKTGANITDVSHAMGLDKRIGGAFLKPGPGYGGSCFPKDTEALAYIAEQVGIDLQVVQAAIAANKHQRELMCKKLISLAENVSDKHSGPIRVAVLGLAFKPGTDDVRYSPAIDLIKRARSLGMEVRAYDPEAIESMRRIIPDITYCSSWQESVASADVVVVVTDWQIFKNVDLEELSSLMRGRGFLDARNLWNPDLLRMYGFHVQNVGRTR